jgi:hypothetical protein
MKSKTTEHRWHNVTAEDQKRITCQRCDNPATICEHAPNRVSISFWYFCEAHGSGLREVLPEVQHAA